MEAHTSRAVMPTARKRFALLAAVLLASMGAEHRTANFIVQTDDAAFAKQVADAAEVYRRDLAIQWLGQPMPNWWQPCVMTVNPGAHLGAGGATSFVFERGEVFNWRMNIQGSRERILDSVLPHEITHMIFACHVRRPLPRWADEGAATTVEHASERNKYRQMLYQYLRTGYGIPFNRMVAITEYPRETNQLMSLYSQGYSVAEFLIQSGGRRKFVTFLDDALKDDDWSGAVERHYGSKNLASLQDTWLAWVRRGSPPAAPRPPQPALENAALAAAGRSRPEPNLIYHIRNEAPPPVRTGELVPLRGSSSSTAVANNAPRGEPIALPASGWRVAGSPGTAAVASATADRDPFSTPTQTAHPQPPEPQGQVILR
jgi:hypothetical protein